MKQPKILFLAAIALLPLMLVSCSLFGGAPVSGGWAGTAFHDGIIYVGTRDGRVVAINASSREQQWSWPDTDTSRSLIYTTPIVDGDLVYVGSYSGQVLALSTLARSQNLAFPQTRYGEWSWNCPKENAKSNAIVAELALSEDALYVANSNGRVYSLDKGSGDENWKREDIPILAEKLWTSPVIRGDSLYVSTFDGQIYSLSSETGQLLNWSFQSEAGFTSSPVMYEGTLFLGSFDRYLYAIEMGGNVSTWRFPQEEPAGNWFWAPPVVKEGVVYAGCLDGKLYAIEAETGEKLWKFDAENPIVSSPVLLDNLLMVVDESGTVYVFDISAEFGDDAVSLKAISIGASVRGCFCAHDGLVYIRGEDNSIYVVDIGKGKVVDGWPVSLTSEE